MLKFRNHKVGLKCSKT